MKRELYAMRSMCQMMAPLTESERHRTLQWICAIFSEVKTRESSSAIDYNEVEAEWNELSTDEERWSWLIMNPGVLVVWLDNDATGVRIKDSDVDANLNRFDGWVSNSKGIPDLLNAIGIEGENV